MPKNKIHKGLLKRIRVTKTGKVKHKRASSGHLKSGKSAKKLRELRHHTMLSKGEAKRAEKLLFRRLRGRNSIRPTVTKKTPDSDE